MSRAEALVMAATATGCALDESVVGWSAVVLFPSLLNASYLAALLRPISWCWTTLPPELLPSMVPIWNSDPAFLFTFNGLAILGLCGLVFWKLVLGGHRFSEMPVYGLCVGLMVGDLYLGITGGDYDARQY